MNIPDVAKECNISDIIATLALILSILSFFFTYQLDKRKEISSAFKDRFYHQILYPCIKSIFTILENLFKNCEGSSLPIETIIDRFKEERSELIFELSVIRIISAEAFESVTFFLEEIEDKLSDFIIDDEMAFISPRGKGEIKNLIDKARVRSLAALSVAASEVSYEALKEISRKK